jgi:hypothetical protein
MTAVERPAVRHVGVVLDVVLAHVLERGGEVLVVEDAVLERDDSLRVVFLAAHAFST